MSSSQTCATCLRAVQSEYDTSCGLDEGVREVPDFSADEFEQEMHDFEQSTGEVPDEDDARHIIRIQNNAVHHSFHDSLVANLIFNLASENEGFANSFGLLAHYASYNRRHLPQHTAGVDFSAFNWPLYLTLMGGTPFTGSINPVSQDIFLQMAPPRRVAFSREANRYLRTDPMMDHMVNLATDTIHNRMLELDIDFQIEVKYEMDPECDSPDLRLIVAAHLADFEAIISLWEELSTKIHNRIIESGRRNNLSHDEIESILDTLTISVRSAG